MPAQGAKNYELENIYTSSAAPKLNPKQKPVEQPQFEVHTNPFAEEYAKAKRRQEVFVKSVACVCACAIMLSFTSISRAVRESAQHELETAKSSLMKLEEANRILNVELNGIIANIDIDSVATEELGLVKVSSENEHYLVAMGENRVLFSQNEQ